MSISISTLEVTCPTYFSIKTLEDGHRYLYDTLKLAIATGLEGTLNGLGIFRLFDVAWVYEASNQLKHQDQLTVKGFNNQLEKYCEWSMGYSGC